MPDPTDPVNPMSFEEWVMSGGEVAEEFKPCVHHDPDGDIIECYWSNEMAVGKYLNPNITIMVGRDTGQVVGVVIDDIKGLMARGQRDETDGT